MMQNQIMKTLKQKLNSWMSSFKKYLLSYPYNTKYCALQDKGDRGLVFSLNFGVKIREVDCNLSQIAPPFPLSELEPWAGGTLELSHVAILMFSLASGCLTSRSSGAWRGLCQGFPSALGPPNTCSSLEMW